MQIFRFEWKRSQKYILIWAVALALCIFSMTPVYYGMVETAGTLPSGFAQGGFFETVGISLELLTKPMGMYSFLTGFFMIAGGSSGCTWACPYIPRSARKTQQNICIPNLVDGRRYTKGNYCAPLPGYV